MGATQSNREFRVKVESLGDNDLLLDKFTGRERVSDPFCYHLRVLANAGVAVDAQSLLYKAVVLSLVDDNFTRNIHGNINRIKLLEAGKDGMTAFEIEMVPWLWFLTLFTDCRIFQNMSVPDIVDKVFQSRGFAKSQYKNKCTGSYNPREYCVQYRETDFNFVSRLLEEEGIYYFFEQEEDDYSLILGDDPSVFVPSKNQKEIGYAPTTGGALSVDTIFTLESEFQVKVGTATLTDYNFTTPSLNLLATLKGTQRGEIYDYPGYYITKDDGDRYTRLRLEEQEVDIHTVRGDSNCMGIECGYRFTLQNHFLDALNAEYVLLGLEHHGRNAAYRAGSDVAFDYGNRLEAIPSSVKFRPARRARKPVIRGSQTALVVGKSGEEIWCDNFGRIKVQFYWDRIGQSDENSSCWIRVAHLWAGGTWGFITLPRISHEVVVSFLEGDPDRPLITGSVYNNNQMPPYALPDNQTQSAWKSLSSKGGGGFNEIRFEDKKSSEQVFIHAEKDLHIRVKNDRLEIIGRDRHLHVTRDKLEKTDRDSHLDLARDHIEKVGRDHHQTISGKEAISITGSHSLSVTGDVIEEFKGNHSSQVTQNLYLKGMQVVVEGMTGLTIKVGGSFVTLNASGVQIFGPMVQINSGGSALSGSPGSLVSPLSPTDAQDAIDTEAGQVGSVSPGSPATPASLTLDEIPPAKPPAKTSPASDAPTHNPNDPANKDKTHFIEIVLEDEAGKPVAGEAYQITLPDGSTVADGTLDDKGYARVDKIDSGTCKVTFPNLDKDAWKPK